MNKTNGFSNFRLGRKFFDRGSSKGSILSVIFAVTEFIMPLLLGISVGWLGTIFIDYALSPKSAELQLNMAANMAAAQNKVDPDNRLTDFLSANPFSISAFPFVGVAEAQTREVNVEVKNSFAKATLTGTFPRVGIWLQDNTNDKLNFISIGENFDAYELTEVLYDRAIFQDNENNDFTKYLYLADTSGGSRVANNTPALPPPPPPPPSQPSNIVASTPGNEGVIGREVIDNLMMNPFDEMKRFRIRPKFAGDEPVGIEVQWIQNDSVLTKLGVQKGDVMKSVNGIPMKNMGDITKGINSLLSGTEFNVEILREGAPINLVYTVTDNAGQPVSIIPTAPSTPITPVENNNRITPANPETVQEGIIGREIIDNLMMNPFDEMKRFRIRPKFIGNEPVGIEVQWIQNDSVLTKLGVQKGDVIKSVNGIPMKNMGDITNGINSIMNATEFNVEILRGNAPIYYRYVVR
ncbi:MAG: hypothetical protein FWF87_02830 [Synergistaceae bacterium]|nr:hypothetical protein [Synergistaceae bacterium]